MPVKIPNPVLITLIGGAAVALPASAEARAPVECASEAGQQVPARVLATMAAAAGTLEANWDYDFNPYPPCSFG